MSVLAKSSKIKERLCPRNRIDPKINSIWWAKSSLNRPQWPKLKLWCFSIFCFLRIIVFFKTVSTLSMCCVVWKSVSLAKCFLEWGSVAWVVSCRLGLPAVNLQTQWPSVATMCVALILLPSFVSTVSLILYLYLRLGTYILIHPFTWPPLTTLCVTSLLLSDGTS